MDKQATEITLARLLERRSGIRYYSSDFPKGESLLSAVIECLSDLAEDNLLVDQLSCLLQLDRLVLNVDGHLHNIVLVLSETGTNIVSFDNGDSLGADITFDFESELSYLGCFSKAYARPFSSSFDIQCQMLYEYSDFSLQAISDTLKVSDLAGAIPSDIFEHMLAILTYNFKKYLGITLRFV